VNVMAIVTASIDCGGAGELLVSNGSAAPVASVLDQSTADQFNLWVAEYSTKNFSCTGTHTFTYDDGASSFRIVEGMPVESALLGLAGIVCAALVAWACVPRIR